MNWSAPRGRPAARRPLARPGCWRERSGRPPRSFPGRARAPAYVAVERGRGALELAVVVDPDRPLVPTVHTALPVIAAAVDPSAAAWRHRDVLASRTSRVPAVVPLAAAPGDVRTAEPAGAGAAAQDDVDALADADAAAAALRMGDVHRGSALEHADGVVWLGVGQQRGEVRRARAGGQDRGAAKVRRKPATDSLAPVPSVGSATPTSPKRYLNLN